MDNMEWTKEKIAEIYHQPLLELLYRSATVHREHHNSREVQISKLVSIKTDGCPEGTIQILMETV